MQQSCVSEGKLKSSLPGAILPGFGTIPVSGVSIGAFEGWLSSVLLFPLWPTWWFPSSRWEDSEFFGKDRRGEMCLRHRWGKIISQQKGSVRVQGIKRNHVILKWSDPTLNPICCNFMTVFLTLEKLIECNYYIYYYYYFLHQTCSFCHFFPLCGLYTSFNTFLNYQKANYVYFISNKRLCSLGWKGSIHLSSVQSGFIAGLPQEMLTTWNQILPTAPSNKQGDMHVYSLQKITGKNYPGVQYFFICGL